VRKKMVTLEEAKMKSSHPDRMKKLLDYQPSTTKR
jgi:hypothetical protein